MGGRGSANDGTNIYLYILHSQNIMYEINSDTKECNITTPPHAFMPIGVPPDAKYLGEGSIGPTGVANEHVTVAAFGAEFNGGKYRWAGVICLWRKYC